MKIDEKKLFLLILHFFFMNYKKMQYKQQYSPNFEKRILHFSKLIRNAVMNMIYE